MRALNDYGGRRVVIVKGKYKTRKGFISIASSCGIYVDLDSNGLRILVQPSDILLLRDDGRVDR